MTLAKLKALGIAALAGTLALGAAPTLARQLAVAGRAPEAKDDLARSVARLQAELDESNRRNARLQDELRAVQDELATRKAAAPGARNTETFKTAVPPAGGIGFSAASGGTNAPFGMMPGMGGGMGGMSGGCPGWAG